METLLTHLIPHTFHFARQEHPERSQATAGWAASPFFRYINCVLAQMEEASIDFPRNALRQALDFGNQYHIH